MAASCREIVNCSKQMAAAGGKKDAYYLSSLCILHIEELGNIDLVIFDGASNVQKAGDILASKYPRISCIHDAEHVASLFFKDAGKIPIISVTIKFYEIIYGFFGSGSRNSTYAIYMENAKNTIIIRKLD